MGSAIKTIRYVYDSRGNRRALIDPDGGRFTYTYDAVNRIKEVQNPQGDRTSYSYDPAGRRTLKRMANGTRASFTYDDDGNLTGLYNLKSDGTVLSSFDYAYDKVGNRTSVLEADGSRVTWSYDNAYQLTGEHRTGTSPYRDTYTYDPTGNRLLKIHDGARTTYAYDAANQLTYSQDVSGRTTYTFDADGNQQVVRAPSGERTTYVWDYENRMTSVRLPSGVRNTMAYDADGLRVKLEESGGTKKFVWDDQNYLAETDAVNDTQVVYTNEPRRYGNLVSQRRGSTSHWYHFDAIGSTRELTNASAVITDTRLYDAWGVRLLTSGASKLFFEFLGRSGYALDQELLMTYVRARCYEVVLGRWNSLDPLWPVSKQWYTYADGNPQGAIDASGLLCCCADECLEPSAEEQHHWFPQNNGKGQREIDAICMGRDKIRIDDYTTSMIDSRENTPHYWYTHKFKWNDEIEDLRGTYSGSCCLFLVNVIDLIHQSYSELAGKIEEMNNSRTAIGCPSSDLPKCEMHKYRNPNSPDTTGDLVKRARDACAAEGKRFSDLGRKLRERIIDRGEGGCNGLEDPLQPSGM